MIYDMNQTPLWQSIAYQQSTEHLACLESSIEKRAKLRSLKKCVLPEHSETKDVFKKKSMFRNIYIVWNMHVCVHIWMGVYNWSLSLSLFHIVYIIQYRIYIAPAKPKPCYIVRKVHA